MIVVPVVHSNSYNNYQSFTFHSSQSALPAALNVSTFERLGLGAFFTVNDDRRSITCIDHAPRSSLLLLLLLTPLTVTALCTPLTPCIRVLTVHCQLGQPLASGPDSDRRVRLNGSRACDARLRLTSTRVSIASRMRWAWPGSESFTGMGLSR